MRNPARLAALAQTGLTDSPAEPTFDRLTRLAATFLGTSVALISLVDDRRQFFKSCFGLPEPWATDRETPLTHSFCQHVIVSREPLVVDDARLDPRVRDNMAITDLSVIAYLGIPLVIDGQVIGSFCAIDVKPRAWTRQDVEMLGDLAESVVSEIRLRNENREMLRQRTLAEQTRQRLQVTLASIGDAVITTDARGSITFMNPVAEALCGTTSVDAYGGPLDSCFRILDEHSREPADCPEARVLASGEAVALTRPMILIAPDGTERTIDQSAGPIKNARDEIEGIVLVFRDSTPRRQAERERELLVEQLRSSEEKFRDLADSMPQLAWMAHPDGHIFWYNKKWYEYTGTSSQEMAGWGWQTVHDPEVLPRVVDRWKESIASGEPFEMVFPLRGADGVFRPFLTRVNPVVDASGRVSRWFGTNTDITERVGMEAALKEADLRKDEFLATLAHELRNPLGAISSGMQLVETTDQPELLAQLREMIQRQVTHLTRLIDDLLDVSRISQGKIDLKKSTLELKAIASRSVELVQPLVTQKRHELTVSLPDRPVFFVADPIRTEQVLSNLITNAAKYTEPGGRIGLEADVQGGEVVFRIHDNGVGISAEMLPKIFGMFTQVDSSIDRSQGGLGIGLTLVRNLVEMHGGTIQAASRGKGRGSEFTVRIPIGQPTSLGSSSTAPNRPRTGSGRVLVVDDNTDTARMTARMLKHSGFEVEIAHDGLVAVDLARRFLPEVVLLDIGLPGMNGYEVANVLRGDEACKSAILIAVSGYGEEKSRERSKMAGFHHHLTKPLDFDRLLTVIGK